jgi:hypothetical protein
MKPLHIHVTLAASNHMAMNGSRLIVMLSAASLGASPAVIGLLVALFGGERLHRRARRALDDRVGLRRPIILASSMVTPGR